MTTAPSARSKSKRRRHQEGSLRPEGGAAETLSDEPRRFEVLSECGFTKSSRNFPVDRPEALHRLLECNRQLLAGCSFPRLRVSSRRWRAAGRGRRMAQTRLCRRKTSEAI